MKLISLLILAASLSAYGQTKTVTVNNSGVLTFPSAATFRANNGAAIGIKQWATGGAMLAGVAEFDGQIQIAADGGMSLYGRTTGNHGGVSILDDILYLKGVNISTSLQVATSTNAGIAFGAPVGPYVDNILTVYNLSGGFASMAAYRPADGGLLPANSAAVAFGYGAGTTRGVPGPYNDRVYIGLSPKGSSPTDNPPDYIVSQEQNAGGAGYSGHVRVELDGVSKNYRLRKFENASVVGAISLESAGTGEIGIGAAASTLAALRVGTATVQNIGLPWAGYFANGTLCRVGIDGNSGTGIELLEGGSRRWGMFSSGGVFGLYNSGGAVFYMQVDGTADTMSLGAGATKLNLNGVAHFTPRTAPGGPTEGDCYQSSADHHFYIWNGTAWKQLDN